MCSQKNANVPISRPAINWKANHNCGYLLKSCVLPCGWKLANPADTSGRPFLGLWHDWQVLSRLSGLAGDFVLAILAISWLPWQSKHLAV